MLMLMDAKQSYKKLVELMSRVVVCLKQKIERLTLTYLLNFLNNKSMLVLGSNTKLYFSDFDFFTCSTRGQNTPPPTMTPTMTLRTFINYSFDPG